MREYKNGGFSLIEIMVVLVILGVSAMIVVLSFNPPDASDELRKKAQRFQVVFDMASDYAILNQTELGLRVEPEKNSYHFLYLDEEQEWQPIATEKFFQETVLEEDFSLELELDGLPWVTEDNNLFDNSIFDESLSVSEEGVEIGEDEEEKPKPPQVFIFSSGEITPFSLVLKFEPQFGDLDVAYFRVNGIDFTPLELEGPLEYL
ncbi:MAG: type II secretion system protein GspH [Alteromonadaceae bacterium]|nr:type II secretion system protein GspH [Alteromonadaceae bacterium]